ncbi:hypothetical protein [Streptomyces sp. NPDC018833]|uniref:hypothetical protein n=1 Tax=Streptomyces sp. NPDC018833 TaxID=3365053 RepID=UPI0037884338
MDATQVNRVFAWAEQRYSRTPCRCGRRKTFALVYDYVVSIVCEDCDTVTPKGKLTRRSPTSA